MAAFAANFLRGLPAAAAAGGLVEFEGEDPPPSASLPVWAQILSTSVVIGASALAIWAGVRSAVKKAKAWKAKKEERERELLTLPVARPAAPAAAIALPAPAALVSPRLLRPSGIRSDPVA